MNNTNSKPPSPNVTVYGRNKALKLKLTRQQLTAIGLLVVKDYRESRKIDPVKVQFFIKHKKPCDIRKGKAWYWWICEYPRDFAPRIDEILKEQALILRVPSAPVQAQQPAAEQRPGKRPRIQRRPE